MDKPDNSLVGKARAVGRALKRSLIGESLFQRLYRRLMKIGDQAKAARDHGDLEGALRGFRQALDLAKHMSRTFGDQRWSFDALRWAYGNLGHILLKLGNLDEAREAQLEAASFAHKSMLVRGDEAGIVTSAAWIMGVLGDIETARKADGAAFEAYSESVRIRRRVLELAPGDPENRYGLGYALYDLGKTIARQGRFDLATTVLEEAVSCAQTAAESAADKANALDLLCWCLTSLGDVQKDLGAPAWAAATFSRAVEVGMSLAALTDDSPDSLDRWFAALDRLGDAWDACFDSDRALEARRQASNLARRRVELSGSSLDALVDLALSVYGLGYAALETNDVDEAVSAFRECASVQRRIVELDARRPQRLQFLATSLYKVCEAEVRAGHLDAGREAADESLAILRPLMEASATVETRTELSAALRTLARLEEAAGRPDLARKAYEEAIAGDLQGNEAGGGFEPASDLAASHLKLSDLEFEAGRRDAAREHRQAGVDFLRRAVNEAGEDWVRIAYFVGLLDNVGDQLLAAGDAELALEIRNDEAELHRLIAHRENPSEETLERLASALRELVMELERAGRSAEASAQRDELTVVEERLRRVRTAGAPPGAALA